jgi:hypothetical protein
MQLKDKPPGKPTIKAALALATGALLGTSAQAQQPQAQQPQAWRYDSAFLYYSEGDRVSAAEAIFNANKTFSDEQVLNLKLTVDVLTGASANGAVAQPTVQTFTRPSGNGQYQINAADTPLDDTFKDTRVQLNGQWTQAISPLYNISAGAHLSKEYDYLSLGFNSSLSRDFNKKNSTLSFGISYFNDTISPEGDIPHGFASMVVGDSESPEFKNQFTQTRLTDKEDKTTADILLGFTQIINQRMIMQFNYSYSMVDGYLSDPFKVLSLVDQSGITQDLLYERRPGQRKKQGTFVQAKYHFETTILDVSYRYMWDDWQINSHTVDAHLRIPLSNNSYLQPHIRYYNQQAAEFYQPFLRQNQILPVYASADYRIGEMNALTLGFKYGMVINQGNELSFRLELYRQDPKNSGVDAPGVLADMQLYEPVDAIIGQVTYSF